MDKEQTNSLIQEVEDQLSRSMARAVVFRKMGDMLTELDQINVEITRAKMLEARKVELEEQIAHAQNLLFSGCALYRFTEDGMIHPNF